MIQTAFGQLIFTAPWALAALAVLPLLYLLLRVTPPAPRRIDFPAARFLQGLIPKHNTPSHTPWWILLLRLLAAALLLLGLAGPVLNPAQPVAGSGPLRLIIENGWSAAVHWDDILKEAEKSITAADRENRQIILITTTDETGKIQSQAQNLMTATSARAALKGYKPYPWAADFKTLDIPAFDGHTLWLSDGLQKTGQAALFEKIKASGALHIIAPASQSLPVVLRDVQTASPHPGVHVEIAKERSSPLTLQALDQHSAVLDQKQITKSGDVVFDLPPAARTQIHSFQIAEQRSAGTRFFLQNTGDLKNIGIVSAASGSDNTALNDDSFFLKNALEPFGTITLGSLQDILKNPHGVIILPDIGAIPPETLNTLDQWVSAGGLLIRFAGPNMTRQSQNIPLTPVKLRNDARTLEGAMSWNKPQKLLPFAKQSPLYGIDLEDEITITQHILPEPADDLSAKTWASLEDGTPLMTAAPQDAGFLIMVHTTAAPTWSNLPLSGTYLEILKRFINFAGNTASLRTPQDGILHPLRTLDGFGALQKPPATLQGIDTAAFKTTPTGPLHPPGLYGREDDQWPLNIGSSVEPLKPLAQSADSTYGGESERPLFPYLLALAFMMMLLDTLIMAYLSSGLRLLRRAAAILLLIFCLPASAGAQELPQAQDLYLAYIKTSNPDLDSQTARGLENMGQILGARTSAAPQGVIGVDIERDDLSFFPLLYWTIENAQTPLSETAIEKLQFYIDHGGTIFIDTRDGASGKNAETLKRTLQSLNIQPLMPLPDDHVLTKSFYLLNTFPGRLNDGKLWVETHSTGRDGVSSIILGSNDWAGAWSEITLTAYGKNHRAIGITREQEFSLRAGVNIVLYALTGNYKSDQVHVPAILERLGR